MASAEAATVYVYVIGHTDGPQKVGFSNRPDKRAAVLKVAGQPHFVVHHQVSTSERDVRGIEALAHWLLREHRQEGEWFAVKPVEAIAAVDAAITRYAAGERCPPREDLMTVRKQIVCTRSWVAAVDRWRGTQSPIPSWGEAVRILAERAVDMEERADAASEPCSPIKEGERE